MTQPVFLTKKQAADLLGMRFWQLICMCFFFSYTTKLRASDYNGTTIVIQYHELILHL